MKAYKINKYMIVHFRLNMFLRKQNRVKTAAAPAVARKTTTTTTTTLKMPIGCWQFSISVRNGNCQFFSEIKEQSKNDTYFFPNKYDKCQLFEYT